MVGAAGRRQDRYSSPLRGLHLDSSGAASGLAAMRHPMTSSAPSPLSRPAKVLTCFVLSRGYVLSSVEMRGHHHPGQGDEICLHEEGDCIKISGWAGDETRNGGRVKAAPSPTRRPRGSSAGSCAIRRGGRVSRKTRMNRGEEFEELRPLIFAIGYRILDGVRRRRGKGRPFFSPRRWLGGGEGRGQEACRHALSMRAPADHRVSTI